MNRPCDSSGLSRGIFLEGAEHDSPRWTIQISASIFSGNETMMVFSEALDVSPRATKTSELADLSFEPPVDGKQLESAMPEKAMAMMQHRVMTRVSSTKS